MSVSLLVMACHRQQDKGLLSTFASTTMILQWGADMAERGFDDIRDVVILHIWHDVYGLVHISLERMGKSNCLFLSNDSTIDHLSHGAHE